jgi:hypothetical protein
MFVLPSIGPVPCPASWGSSEVTGCAPQECPSEPPSPFITTQTRIWLQLGGQQHVLVTAVAA